MVHEVFHLGRIRHIEHRDPAFPIGIFIDQFGGILELFIYFDDLAADRAHDGGRGFRGFDFGDFLHRADFLPDLRQFDVDNVSQLVLCIIRDADHGPFALGLDPLMLFGKFQVFGIHDLSRAPYEFLGTTPPLRAPSPRQTAKRSPA